jgi:hypothetical protein
MNSPIPVTYNAVIISRHYQTLSTLKLETKQQTTLLLVKTLISYVKFSALNSVCYN